MKKRTWKFSVIHHPARRALGLSQNEYTVFDLIYKSQTHPEMNVGGWCSRSYRRIADDLGIAVGTVHAIIDRGFHWNLLEVNPAKPNLKKTLPAFYDVAYLEETELESVEVKPVQKMNVQKMNGKRSENEQERSGNERKRSENEPLSKESIQMNLLKEEAVQVIEFFKSVSGRSKVSTATSGKGSKNVDTVVKLLKKGFTREELELIVVFKCWEWKGTRSEKYIRISTIFGAKVEAYLEDAQEAQENPAFLRALKSAKETEEKQNGKVVAGDFAISQAAAESLANW